MADENVPAAEAPAKLTSKTIVLVGHGGYDKLKIQQNDRPSPGKDQVLVNVKATGVNFSELMCRAGMYDRCPKLPAVLGWEGSGIITEVGEGVDQFTVGDRVMCLQYFGLWTEYAAVNVTNVFLIPDEMTFEEAAAIPVTYMTAHVCLFNFGNLRPNQSVLLHMAAGGVGTAATQLCKTVENVTLFGTASAEKHDQIKENGVTHPIDYRTTDYVAEVKKINPEGVDIVMDPLAGDDASKGYNLLKPLGKIIHYGGTNIVTGPTKNYMQMIKTWWSTKSINPMHLMAANKAVCGVNLGSLTDKDHIDALSTVLREIIQLYKDGKIKPVIDSVWAYEDVDLAMAKMHDRKNIGKVILSTEKAAEVRPEPEKKEKKIRSLSVSKKTKKQDKKEEKKDETKKEENNEEKKDDVKEDKADEEKNEVEAAATPDTPAEVKTEPAAEGEVKEEEKKEEAKEEKKGEE